VPVFPSEDWAAAWIALANASEEFERSGAGFAGSIVLVVEFDRIGGLPDRVYLRLSGESGKWVSHELGRSDTLLEGALFVLQASYARWKALIRQELHPIKALLQGKIRIRGHLPEFLKWTRSVMILAELAGQVETEFLDEVEASPSPVVNDGA
jgi:putative sterol carrier protein